MIPTDNKTKTTDIWFEQQLEAIRQLKPKQTPDVTDAVMQRIASMPQPMALPKRHSRINTRLANGLVAACFVGIVVTTFLVTRNGAQAATPHPDLSNRFYAPVIEKLSARIAEKGGGEAEQDFIGAMVGVSVKNFESALDLIDQHYGSLANYLAEALNFSTDEQQRLRDKYLTQ